MALLTPNQTNKKIHHHLSHLQCIYTLYPECHLSYAPPLMSDWDVRCPHVTGLQVSPLGLAPQPSNVSTWWEGRDGPTPQTFKISQWTGWGESLDTPESWHDAGDLWPWLEIKWYSALEWTCLETPTANGKCCGHGCNQSGRNEVILKRHYGYQTSKTKDPKIRFSNTSLSLLPS